MGITNFIRKVFRKNRQPVHTPVKDDAVNKLQYAIASLIGIAGAFHKCSDSPPGKDDEGAKTALTVLGGCFAMIVMAKLLPGLFTSILSECKGKAQPYLDFMDRHCRKIWSARYPCMETGETVVCSWYDHVEGSMPFDSKESGIGFEIVFARDYMPTEGEIERFCMNIMLDKDNPFVILSKRLYKSGEISCLLHNELEITACPGRLTTQPG